MNDLRLIHKFSIRPT